MRGRPSPGWCRKYTQQRMSKTQWWWCETYTPGHPDPCHRRLRPFCCCCGNQTLVCCCACYFPAEIVVVLRIWHSHHPDRKENRSKRQNLLYITIHPAPGCLVLAKFSAIREVDGLVNENQSPTCNKFTVSNNQKIHTQYNKWAHSILSWQY